MAADTLALEKLYLDIVARFTTEAPSVEILFGWREPAKQLNQGTGRANRVCIVPGIDGKAGSYDGAKRPGRNPRPLATFNESATVYVWAYDASGPNDELKQWKACRLLHDAVIRALELSTRSETGANVQLEYSDPEWLGPTERRFGAELRFVLDVESMIPDSPYTEVLAGGELSHYINSDNAGADQLDAVDEYPLEDP